MTEKNTILKAATAAGQRTKEKEWWLDTLADLPSKVHFPYDRQLSANDYQYAAGTVTLPIPDELSSRLLTLVNNNPHALHVVLTACVAVLLNKYQYAGANDMVLGMPIYRQSAGTGLINTVLPLRIRFTPGMSFKDLLVNVRQIVRDAVSNQNYPIEILLDQLNAPVINRQCPIFDTAVLLDNIHDKSYLSPVQANTLFCFNQTGSQLEGVIEYNRHLFGEATAKQIARHFSNVLNAVMDRIAEPLESIDLLDTEEKTRVLETFNDLRDTNSRSFQPNQTIHGRFEEQVRKTPDHIALHGPSAGEQGLVTYSELNRRADILAGQLKENGASPGSIIGLMMERSIEMITTVIAILKTGSAYLPIDPEYPRERIDYMIADSSLKIILSNNPEHFHRRDRFQTCPQTCPPTPENEGIIIYLDKQRHAEKKDRSETCPYGESNPGNLLYVIYTSGSTGRPKGVMLEHRNLVNLMEYQFQYTSIDFSRVLQFTTISFDVSFQEIFSTLLSGGTLFLVDNDTRRDIPRLLRLIDRHYIKTLFFPASFLKFAFNRDEYRHIWPNRVSHIVTAGEQLIIGSLFRQYLEENHITIHNHYGPSESHVVTALTMAPGDEKPELPSIGKPILNSPIYIVDHNGCPMPVGVPGELFISGIQVARGYLNNVVMTVDKFFATDLHRLRTQTYTDDLFKEKASVPSVSSVANNFYKTGDLARWLPDGNIQFLGRMDEQVKIRGFRVELGEIETYLTALDGIEEAVVVARGEDEKYLCAYVVPGDSVRLDIAVLREELARRLPEYMVPSYVVPLKAIPLTPNRKVDRKALPDPEIKAAATYAAPSTPLEKALAEHWAGVLEIKTEQIGIDDNFFQLGGHSLKATILLSRLEKAMGADILLADMFRFPTIRTLAAHIDAAQPVSITSIEPAEKKEYYPLSPAQKRLFILQQMDKTNTSYNMPTKMILEGDLKKEKFQQTFCALMERHESFRTSFVTVGEEPVQRVHDARDIEFSLVYHDHSGERQSVGDNRHNGQTVVSEKTKEIIDAFVRPFDFSSVPLFRVGLIKLNSREHVLLFDMHHVLTDGTSQGIMIREFMDIYAGKEFAPLHLQYKDYSQWMRGELQQKAMKKQEEYWLNRFRGEITPLTLPYDFKRPEVQQFSGSRVPFRMDEKETALLKQMAARIDGSLFMVLLAIYNILLWRLSGRDDIVVGTPIAARRHADLEPIMGMFVNTLVLKNSLSSNKTGNKTFKEFLEQVKTDTLDAFENQEYPFEELVEKVNVPRDAARNPLFDVMFALQNWGMPSVEIKGLQLKSYPSENKTAKFDLNLDAFETGDTLYFSLEYSTSLFKENTILRFIDYFKRIARQAVEQPFSPISQIDILDSEEKQDILSMSNGPTRDDALEKTIHGWFGEQAQKTPNAIAVHGPGTNPETMTYKELNRQSGHLAQHLKSLGVRPDSIAGLMMTPSPQMIVAMLAILKTGAGYMPIAPEYPQERINYMIEDSNTKIILSNTPKHTPRRDRFQTCPQTTESDNIIIHLDKQLDGEKEKDRSETCPYGDSNPGNLLYVIYTSGSTGKPKGVMLEHRNLVNLMNYQYRYTSIDFSRVLQFTTISFDVSFQEIFSTLLAGGTLFLIEPAMRQDIPRLFQTVEQHRIRTLFLPASFVKFVFNSDEYIEYWPGSVDHIVTAGEQLVVSHRFHHYLHHKKITLHNHYGPTESHVVTTYSMPPGQDIPELPSIGKPVSNTAIFILDPNNRLQPPGIPGELIISGIQVARGYLNNPELTADKFIKEKAHSSKLIAHREKEEKKDGLNKLSFFINHQSSIINFYSTGDLARWLPDGNIEFLGRKDEQVKIRGFRIELGEIESRLMAMNGINEAVVITRSSRRGENSPGMDDKYLCAYIVTANETGTDSGDIREQLAETLPDYMVPSYIIPLENIPLTPNRKIDRKALPAPVYDGSGTSAPPRNHMEKTVARLWAELLDIEPGQIGIDDDFFRLGGHSLKAMVFISRLNKETGIDIRLVEMFNKPTIRLLAGLLESKQKTGHTGVPLAEKKEYYPLSPAQKRLFILQKMDNTITNYNMTTVRVLEGELQKEKFERILRQLLERHECLRTSFHTVNGTPVQRVHETGDVELTFQYFDNPQDPGEVAREFVRPFDFEAAPLFRAGLIKIHSRQHILLFDMHHVLTDGASQGILVREFMDLYAGKTLPPLPIQYKDYSQWLHQNLKDPAYLRQEQYWINRFKDEIPVLSLPYDYNRPAFQRFEGNRAGFVLDSRVTSALKQLAGKVEGSLFMVLLAVYNVWLYKLSGNPDIVVGTPAAARRHADLEPVIGMFVNTLPLRNFLAKGMTFQTFLEDVKQHSLDAFENQEYPFEELVEKVSVPRDPARNPLFDVMFAMQNWEMTEVKLEGLQLKPFALESLTSKFDLTLSATEMSGSIRFSFEYCTALFKETTINRFMDYFNTLLQEVAAHPGKTIGNLEIIPHSEKQRVLVEFNRTEAHFPDHKTVPLLFEEAVSQRPEQVALVHKSHHVTYRELNLLAGHTAKELTAKGAGPGRIIAIMGERSIPLIAGIIGIIKTGAAYLPLDVSNPPERTRFVCRDSQCDFILATPAYRELAEKSSGIPVIPLNHSNQPQQEFMPVNRDDNPRNLIYVIYTSGSTGRPKGVMVEHRGVVNILTALQKKYPLDLHDAYLFKTNYAFDVSVTEIFGWFFGRGRLVILEDGLEKDPAAIIDNVNRFRVSHINFVPSMLNALIDSVDPGSLRGLSRLKYIIAAGEAFSPSLAEKIMPLQLPARVENIFGPTEASIYTTGFSLKTHDTQNHTQYQAEKWTGISIPIGTPLPNNRNYILDSNLQPLPIGLTGEFFLSGPQLARGYLNNPELTSETFIQAPISIHNEKIHNEKILYRTGDLARWLPCGNIQFMGRIDQQVKIRGFRIELGEIQNRLTALEDINEAVVTIYPGPAETGNTGDYKYICAYVVPHRKDAADTEKWKRMLSNDLPEYMIPSYFVILENIPVTPSGKIDRKALPAPEPKQGKSSATFRAPNSQIEKAIAETWKEVLQIEKIGIHDNFFDLGGNSLLLIKVNSLLKERLNKDIPVMSMFKHPTISTTAGIIMQENEEAAARAERSAHKDTLDKGKNRMKKTMNMRKKMKR